MKIKTLKLTSSLTLLMFGATTILSFILPNSKKDMMLNNETEGETYSVIVEDNQDFIVSLPAKEKSTEKIQKDKEEITTEIETEIKTEEVTTPQIITIPCMWADFSITVEEFRLICTTVYCESGNQDMETQIMVALTILNRYVAGYGDSINEVIYDTDAYEVTGWKNFENRGWTESVETAVTYALEYNEHPRDMYYFRTKYYHGFANSYMKSGDLYFSTQD